MLFTRAIASAALLAATLAAQDVPVSWELALPNAKYLGAVDLQHVRDSSLARTFETQLAGSVLVNGAITVRIPGLDRLNELIKVSDRLFVSSNGAGNTVATAFVGVLEGSFQPDRLNPLLQGQSQTYRGIGVYRIATSGDLSIALLAQRIVLFGDEKSILSALDRWGTASPNQGSSTLVRVAALASTNDFWMFWPDVRSIVLPFGRRMPPEIQQIEIGFTYRDGMSIDMNYTFTSDITARKFAQFYAATSKSITPIQAKRRLGLDLIRRAQASSMGNRAQLHIVVTKEDSAQLAQVALTSLNPLTSAPVGESASELPMATASGTAPAEIQPEPGAPKKIKIYGLDDGVKEIPLNH